MFQHRMLSLFVAASLSLRGGEAFLPYPSTTPKIQAKSMPDITAKEEDGSVVRIPVKNIERNWSFDNYKADGEFSVDLFYPENKQVKGCAFFMHGFSQYPIAYRKTLKQACENSGVAIIACETGLLSDIVQKESKKVSFFKRKEAMQFLTQRALSQDTKQCIQMVLDGSDVFAEYGITKKSVQNKLAVIGHSMGGGLSFPVAADFEDIDYVFAMAPAFGEEEFDPISKGVQKRAPKNTMLLAGGWDLIAPKKKIQAISAAANKSKNDSSVLVNIERGLHTGFEDKLVLFNFNLSSASTLLTLLGILDSTLFGWLKLLNFLRVNTGQLAGTRALLEYVLTSMVDGKQINCVDAEKYLDDNITDRFEDKFEFEFGGSE